MQARDIKYYEAIWDNRNGDRPLRTEHSSACWDQRADYWVKHFNMEVENTSHRNRMLAIAAFLRERGQLLPDHDVIDIGSGPGYYAAEFARTAHHATASDISPRMMEHGREYARAKGLDNISFVCCDFKQADIGRMGWSKAFDLVFTSITPAFYGVGAIQKMALMSRGHCFNNGWVYMRNTVETALRHMLLGDPPATAQDDIEGKGIYSLFNILWLMGYRPEIRYYKERSVDHVRVDDEMVAHYAQHLFPGQSLSPAQALDILKALRYLSDDGVLTNTFDAMFAFMLWETE